MDYEPEGIRHIEINTKSKNKEYSDDNKDEDSYSSDSSSSSLTSIDSDSDSNSDSGDDSDAGDLSKEDPKSSNNDEFFDIEEKYAQSEDVETHQAIQKDNVHTKKTNKVNFDSLLKAVVEISDKIEDQERKLKQFEEFGENDRYKKKNFPPKRDRPKTAVLQYREESDYSSFDQHGSEDESVLSTVSRTSSNRRRAQSASNADRFSDTASASRMNMSFSNDEVRHIDKENQRLLNRLLRTKVAKQSQATQKTPPQQRARVQSASAINRNRRQQEIDRENLRILHRLQSVKPTTGLERNSLLNEQYSDRIGRTRPASAISSKKRPISASIRPASGKMSGKYLDDDTASVKSSSSTQSRRSTSGKLSRMNYERQKNWNERW